MIQRLYLSARRVCDVVAAAALLLVLLPVFVVIALVILVTMGRPILFRQVRQGQHEEFELLKFRTMVKDAERIGGGYMAPDLNLIPPVGAFLRATSLEELPQLVNILAGDMSFIGPRPALPSQVARYTPRQRGRLDVPQGVTDLAQVRYRNEAPWSVRIESDLEYVRKVGPLLDARIVVATVAKVLGRSGVRSDQTAAEVDDLAQPKQNDT